MSTRMYVEEFALKLVENAAAFTERYEGRVPLSFEIWLKEFGDWMAIGAQRTGPKVVLPENVCYTCKHDLDGMCDEEKREGANYAVVEEWAIDHCEEGGYPAFQACPPCPGWNRG